MVAIDLDGTLLSPEGRVTPRTKAAVHRALAAGLLVCFATGRNYTESKTVLDAVAHYDTAIFVGGAMIIDTRNQRIVHRTVMGTELANEVCGFLESHGHAVLALQDTEAAGVDYLVTDGITVNEATARWLEVTAAAIGKVPSLGTHEHEHTVRVGIVAPAGEMPRLKTELAEKFGERIYTHSIFVPAYGVEVLEVFEPGVNKWQAILHVAGRHGIRPEEIVAIGDDVNDLHMLKNAGLGVAMGNAVPSVKAIAKRIIAPNSEEGLAQFLEELIDSHEVEPLAPKDI